MEDWIEATDVVGDVDAFMEYVESGQAEQDWNERMTIRHGVYLEL